MSSNGRITVPIEARKDLGHKQFLLRRKGKKLILEPLEYRIVEEVESDNDFGLIGLTSFDSWGNPDDDIYYEFYKKNQNETG